MFVIDDALVSGLVCSFSKSTISRSGFSVRSAARERSLCLRNLAANATGRHPGTAVTVFARHSVFCSASLRLYRPGQVGLLRVFQRYDAALAGPILSVQSSLPSTLAQPWLSYLFSLYTCAGRDPVRVGYATPLSISNHGCQPLDPI